MLVSFTVNVEGKSNVAGVAVLCMWGMVVD